MVDLAGSERQSKTHSEVCISDSLSAESLVDVSSVAGRTFQTSCKNQSVSFCSGQRYSRPGMSIVTVVSVAFYLLVHGCR